MSAKQQVAPMVSGALTVKDRPQADRDLASLVSRTGAREIARRQEGNATIVDVVVPQAGYADFLRELGGLGALAWRASPTPRPPSSGSRFASLSSLSAA